MLQQRAFRPLAWLCAAVALLLWLAPAQAQEFTLKYGHVDQPSLQADDHVAGLFLEQFIESRSKGRIDVQIFPASQMGNFREMFEGVQLGTLELTNTTVGGANQFFPQIQVTDIPYMYKNDRVAEAFQESWFWDDVRDAILEKTGNVRLISVGNTGRWRSFFTTDQQVKSAADLNGLKIRTINSPLQVELVEYLGGNPTPIAWGELYTALATGVAEGTKNAMSDIVGKNMHEHLNYVVLDEHAYLYAFWWMSDSWLNSLPPDLQELVINGVRQASNLQREFNKYLEMTLAADFREAGGSIYVPSGEELETFKAAQGPMKEWFVNNVDNGQEWLDKLERAVADAEKAVADERGRIMD